MNNLRGYINNGQFGYNSPSENRYNTPNNYYTQYNNGYYNPYGNQMPQNNIIPIGDNCYSGYNPYQASSNFVFRPVASYDMGYQNSNNYDYYNPYGSRYDNNYYYGYSSAEAYGRIRENSLELQKKKLRIAYTFLDIKYTEEELDRKVDPDKYYLKDKNIDRKELVEQQEFAYIKGLFERSNLKFNNPELYHKMYPYLTNAERIQIAMIKRSNDFHEKYDDKSLFQMMNHELALLKHEQWKDENLSKNADRDLSTTYNSKEYNQILNLHNSGNSIIDELLNDSRYDGTSSNRAEIGLNSLKNIADRRSAILEGRIPSFTESKEIREKRRAWTDAVMAQLYNKVQGGGWG